MGSVAVEFEHI